MYAIIETGGHQHKVAVGDVIRVEKLAVEEGTNVDFDALMTSNDGEIAVGSPILDGVKVSAKVLAHGKGDKIIVYKFKAKKNYRRKQGHRQPYTKVEITEITGA